MISSCRNASQAGLAVLVPDGELGGAPGLAGDVFWASAVPDDSTAPPNSPAVPLSKVRRDTDCRRIVFSVIFRSSQASDAGVR
jgi:hypothetical protein